LLESNPLPTCRKDHKNSDNIERKQIKVTHSHRPEIVLQRETVRGAADDRGVGHRRLPTTSWAKLKFTVSALEGSCVHLASNSSLRPPTSTTNGLRAEIAIVPFAGWCSC